MITSIVRLHSILLAFTCAIVVFCMFAVSAHAITVSGLEQMEDQMDILEKVASIMPQAQVLGATTDSGIDSAVSATKKASTTEERITFLQSRIEAMRERISSIQAIILKLRTNAPETTATTKPGLDVTKVNVLHSTSAAGKKSFAYVVLWSDTVNIPTVTVTAILKASTTPVTYTAKVPADTTVSSSDPFPKKRKYGFRRSAEDVVLIKISGVKDGKRYTDTLKPSAATTGIDVGYSQGSYGIGGYVQASYGTGGYSQGAYSGGYSQSSYYSQGAYGIGF